MTLDLLPQLGHGIDKRVVRSAVGYLDGLGLPPERAPETRTGACLIIGDGPYALQRERGGEWTELAVLAGGAGTLLGETRPLGEASLEAAIERAEDWLMPHAASLQDQVLEAIDATGRLKPGLERVFGVSSSEWTVQELEALFLSLVEMATGRKPPPALEGQSSSPQTF